MELLRELHCEGATIVMVTHDPRYAQHAERAVNLLDGRILNDAIPSVTAKGSGIESRNQ
jgi:putative ABC transport system ATP-binding protein